MTKTKATKNSYSKELQNFAVAWMQDFSGWRKRTWIFFFSCIFSSRQHKAQTLTKRILKICSINDVSWRMIATIKSSAEHFVLQNYCTYAQSLLNKGGLPLWFLCYLDIY